MNKYEMICWKNEKMPDNINEAVLNMLLSKIKKIIADNNDFIELKDLTNKLTLTIILNNFHKFNKKEKEYIEKNIINRFNINALYGFFIRNSCNYLLKKKYDLLSDLLKSFVATNLVKSANLSKDKKYITIILNDNSVIKYSNIPLHKNIIDTYRGKCHFVSDYFIRNNTLIDTVIVMLENNEVYGKYYHSLVSSKDIIYDFSHNIVMDYDNYIKLFNPTILIKESKDTYIEETSDLIKSNDEFKKSNYGILLKYAIEKSLNKSTRKKRLKAFK